MTTTDTLPVTADDARTYFRIRPSKDVVNPSTFAVHSRRLYDLLETESPRFRRATPPDLLEVLLVVDRQGALSYLIGVTADEKHDRLERTLRSLFPRTYEIDRVTRASNWLTTLTTDPDGATDTTTADNENDGDGDGDGDGDDDGGTQTDTTSEIAAVEYRGKGKRPKDWQMCLTPYETFVADEHASVPLASVVETLTARDRPAVFQTLIRPKPEWTRAAENRAVAIEGYQDTILDQVVNAITMPEPNPDVRLPAADQDRIDELNERDTRTSFDVAARVVTIGPAAERTANDLQSSFTEVSCTAHRITNRLSTGRRAQRLFEAVVDRTLPKRRLRDRLPGKRHTRPAIVADSTELANFIALDGTGLTTAGERAIGTTPGERRKLPRPPTTQLAPYHEPGITLGHPLSEDGIPEPEPINLPVSLQRLHLIWIGKSGAGKSTSLGTGLGANVPATTGANIIMEPKGDGMTADYLRTHYATHGTLENVSYFDCRDLLPAVSILDVRPDLEAGRDRADAVTDRVDHVVDILRQLMGAEQFDAAVRSPTVLKYGLRAAFDTVHGDDAFGLRDLQDLFHRMHDRETPPPTVDTDVERALEELTANHHQTFDQIMGGVATRIEKLAANPRLAQLFNNVPGPTDPQFRFDELLDEQAVIIFDMGGLREETKRGLTLVLISLLWSALKRRKQRAVARRESTIETADSDSSGPLPLVNLYVEEAASIAGSTTLAQLLREGRAFDISVTLATQYPSQLRDADPTLYREILNDISTLVVGNVGLDRDLAARLATADQSAQDVANRLRALRRGEWVVTLPAAFDETEPRPFVVRSAKLPEGHPDGDQPLTPRQRAGLVAARDKLDQRTEQTIGIRFDARHATTTTADSTSDPSGSPVTGDGETQTATSSSSSSSPSPRVDTLLPYTQRLPEGIQYDAERRAIHCQQCLTRFDSDIHGLKDSLNCCGSLAAVDRGDIPVCDVNLKLTPAEIEASEWSITQLLFLQVVWSAQTRRYDPLEYDIRRDSMVRLREYVDIETDAVDALLDAGLLRDHDYYPHQLYSVTPEGRDAIGEHNREGITHGDGQGDLGESSQHVMLVDLAQAFVEREYVDDPDSAVDRVEPYYELEDGHRLDLVGLDAAGEIVLTVEAERKNHDLTKAAPKDFDKMAACTPTESLWIARSQTDAVCILEALYDPADGESRIPKLYSEQTPITDYQYDTAGLTDVYTARWLKKELFD